MTTDPQKLPGQMDVEEVIELSEKEDGPRAPQRFREPLADSHRQVETDLESTREHIARENAKGGKSVKQVVADRLARERSTQ